MKSKAKSILCLLLMICTLGCFAACSEEAAIVKDNGQPTYESLKAKVDAFDEVYAYYVYDHSDELDIKNGEDFTPLGAPCSYTYISNKEGANKAGTVKSCTITVNNADGSTIVDEYFAVDASTLFIARTTVSASNGAGTVSKYACLDNKLYEINESEATMTWIDKADTLDLYLSFKDISNHYAK